MPENMEILKKSVGTHREDIGANLKDFQWPELEQMEQQMIQARA